MARADHNEKIPKIQADWRTGHYSQRELARKYGVSLGFVAKNVKGLEQDAVNAVNAGVVYKQALASDNEHLVNAVNTVVDERTRSLTYFTNSALRNQRKANALLEEAETMAELAQHSGLTARNKETVLGKQPDTAIQINNSQPALDVSMLSIETQREIARASRR